MDSNKENLLKMHYNALNGQLRFIEKEGDKEGRGTVQAQAVRVLERQLQQLESDFPGLVPEFSAREHFSHKSPRGKYFYNMTSLGAHLSTVLGCLQVELEADEGKPVTETREFPFIKDPEIRSIVERDYQELQRAYLAYCWKSVIVLSGGAIEAILTDLLLANNNAALGSSKTPNQQDITRWVLQDIIEVAVDIGLIGAGVQKLSHSVREYRNLVHPGNEIRNKLKFDKEEAKIALEVLHIIHRELS